MGCKITLLNCCGKCIWFWAHYLIIFFFSKSVKWNCIVIPLWAGREPRRNFLFLQKIKGKIYFSISPLSYQVWTSLLACLENSPIVGSSLDERSCLLLSAGRSWPHRRMRVLPPTFLLWRSTSSEPQWNCVGSGMCLSKQTSYMSLCPTRRVCWSIYGQTSF